MSALQSHDKMIVKAFAAPLGDLSHLRAGEKQFNIAKDESGATTFWLMVEWDYDLKEWVALDSEDEEVRAQGKTLAELTTSCHDYLEFFQECQEENGETIYW